MVNVAKILIVVDYQRDFVCGSLGFAGAEKLDKLIADRVRDYGRNNVFYTLDTHFDDYLSTREGTVLPVAHCIKGTPGHSLYGETASALDEVGAVGFEKSTFGLKLGDDILAHLPDNIEEIELCGLVSNICVLSNAVIFSTAFENARITVDARLTACSDSELNEKALDIMQGLQINVINRGKNNA